MIVFHFVKEKYGKEILMDFGSNNDIINYFFETIAHQTDFFEIIFFEKGNGYLELDSQKIKIEDNTIIFISPYQVRKWFVNKEKIKSHFLFFKNDFLSKFFTDRLFTYRLQFFYNKTNPLFIKIDRDLLNNFQNTFENIIAELNALKSDSEHLIRSLLYFILIKLNRIYSESNKLSSETQINTISFKFKMILINEIRNNRSTTYYAQKLGISRITLNKIVKKQFGITCKEMIDDFMIYEIKSLLISTSLNINEIANQMNFSEANHLSRFFKHHTNLTPSQFKYTYQIGI